MNSLTCFKAYDIRGQLGRELNEEVARRIARAYSAFFSPTSWWSGGTALESASLEAALAEGCGGRGDVIDIGLCGTEEIYFAAFHLAVDGGIMVTASHNPIDYNGMKLVRGGRRRSAAIPG